MNNNNELVSAKNLYRSFNKYNNKTEVLKGINISIQRNELTAIMGRSGSGKTTLLKLLGLIDKPTSGQVIFKGEDSKRLFGDKLATIHRNSIGFIYQDYYLMDSLSVIENIMLPKLLNREPSEICRKSAVAISMDMGISLLLDKRPYELSGGEKQRVAICRALMNDPELILADEPTGNLDVESADAVLRHFDMIHRTNNTTIVIVTHDPSVANCCNRVVFLEDGRIAADIRRNCDYDTFFDRIIEKQKSILRK